MPSLMQSFPRCGLGKQQYKLLVYYNLLNHSLWGAQRSVLTSPKGDCDAHSFENHSSKEELIPQDISSPL